MIAVTYTLFYDNASTIFFFFFNDTATTEIYTLSLHDALPISGLDDAGDVSGEGELTEADTAHFELPEIDRKSTRLNSSHTVISYAVFCLKKKKSNVWANISVMQTCECLRSLSLSITGHAHHQI